MSDIPNKARLDNLRRSIEDEGLDKELVDERHANDPPPLTYGELRALLDAYERQRALLESAENVLRNAELDGMADRIRAELERDQ
jgi:hypothetical protein